MLGESKDGEHRQPGAQQQHWHRRHGKCDCRKNVTWRVRRLCIWEGHLYIEVSTHMYVYFIKFNEILFHKLTGRELNRMDFKQEYFINTATDDKRDGDYNLYSRLVKLFHIAPPDTESTGCFRKNYSQTQEIKIPTIERSWFLRYHLYSWQNGC